MLFTSYDYVFLLLPLTFIFYHCLPHSKWQNIVLLVASYVFYIWESHFLIVLIVISSAVDYFVGLALGKTDKPAARKWLLFLSVFINLGLLGVFKYSYWFISGMNAFLLGFGIDTGIKPVQLPLPPGISFYTFQTLSYTIDVYRKQFKPHRDVLSFLTYVAFFPQLIAGPIERCGHLLPQLAAVRKTVSYEKIESGVFLIAWGIFKKVVFADNLGHVVARCLENLEEVPGIGFIAVFAFSFQIYCDFSAYTDIARGTARFFNIELTRNFKTPYFATSPSDYWQRWHISLSSWIRDYVYTPMFLGLRWMNVKWRLYVSLLLTMAVMGLWHGAGMFFVLWGVYHGCILILYSIFPIDKLLKNKFGSTGHWASVFIMFIFTLFGWVLFMSDPSPRFLQIMTNLAWGFQAPFHSDILIWLYPMLLYTLPVIFTESLAYSKKVEFVDFYSKIPFWGKVGMYYVMFYAVSILGKREAYDFIYFAF